MVDTSIKFTDRYWECNCPTHYLHAKLVAYCTLCKTERKDGKDAILQEVGKPELMAIYSQQDRPEVKAIYRRRKKQVDKIPWWQTEVGTVEGLFWILVADILITELAILISKI